MENNKQQELTKEVKNPIVFRLVENEINKDYVFEENAGKTIFFAYYENNKENTTTLEDKEELTLAIEDNLIGKGFIKLTDTKELNYTKPLIDIFKQVPTSKVEESTTDKNKKNNIKEESIQETVVEDKQTTMQEEFKRVKKQEFLKFFRDGLGIITLTCKRINLSRSAFYVWYKEDTKFKETVDGIKSEQHSEVEDKLLNAITDGNISAIIFYLKSKHPDYKYRVALEGEIDIKGDYNRLNDEELKERIKKHLSKLEE